MAKRLTPFIGLAVVAALALAAAFGAFSLSPAVAGTDAPDARGLATPQGFQPQAIAGYPPLETSGIETGDGDATARTDIEPGANPATNMWLNVGQTVTIDLKDSIENTTPAVVGTGANLDAWAALVPDTSVVTLAGGTASGAASTGHLVTSTSTEVRITGAAAGTALVRIEAYDYDSSHTPPVDFAGEVEHSFRTFTVTVVAPTLEAGSVNPGASTRYDVTFVADSDLNIGDEIRIEMEDYDFPGSMNADQINLSSNAYYLSSNDVRATPTQIRSAEDDDAKYQGGFVSPSSAYVSGEELRISLPDMNPNSEPTDGIRAGDTIIVRIQQGAGVSNPTEGGDYSAIINTTGRNSSEHTTNEVNVVRLVELNEEDGGRGTVVTATGKGFKNGTSLAFFLDKAVTGTNARPLNGMRDLGEVVLCDVASIGSDDTGSCSFTVSNPPFEVGDNFVGAMDGRGQPATKSPTHNHDDQKFELTPTISASPNSGNPGDTILIQMYDFPAGQQVTRVDLARQIERDANTTNRVFAADAAAPATTGSDGSANFRMTIPNWAPEGVLDLKVIAGGKNDNINITIGGPVITSTPSTVLANQRINLVGSGFTPNTRVCCGDARTGEDTAPLMSIGGQTIDTERINDGDDVRVDNGGNWSASIDLPLNQVTSDEGTREILVRDSGGRSGNVDVTIPARTVIIDPPVGRGGTIAIVRGTNFPSKNDGGDSFNVEITYTAGDTNVRVSTVPDASGRFEAEIRIPTSANIPSTNTVQVVYEYGENDIPVTTTVTHDVPEGSLSLSRNDGPADTMVTVRGEGFRNSVPIQSVSVGDIDVTPSPRPSTTPQGTLEFDIRIPGVDTGVQTIEVEISGTTASIGFRVTESDVIGAETAVATGVANLGDNFVRAFYFNNNTKEWTFYDPAAGDASSLKYFVAGNSYWFLVSSDQSDVILNRESRNLTCANGNCWNVIVW